MTALAGADSQDIAHGSRSLIENIGNGEVYKTSQYLTNLDGTRSLRMLESVWSLEDLGQSPLWQLFPAA
jgi:hypothetical protein